MADFVLVLPSDPATYAHDCGSLVFTHRILISRKIVASETGVP